jgi:ribosomal 30S subunit maturation factor RimM
MGDFGWNGFAVREFVLCKPKTGGRTMDHSNHVRLAETELTPSVLEGATVYGADDHKVGKVDHVHGVGANTTAIIDVGVFLGIGAKPVAVPISDLDFMRDEDGDVHAVTSWTKDQLKDMPEHRH